jgi:hypothetical protein
LQKIGVGFSFFQYSITPILHRHVELSRVMESPLPGAKERQVLGPRFFSFLVKGKSSRDEKMTLKLEPNN